MSDSADMEIDLSAQELLALSALPQVEQPSSAAKKASPGKRGSLYLSTIAAVAVIGATYVLTKSDRGNLPAADTPQHLAQSQWPAPQQLATGEPVRFANPFDTDEVFEFPAGTTETEARDAVADVLLKRAMSRQKT
jgi:hypothetical protein